MKKHAQSNTALRIARILKVNLKMIKQEAILPRVVVNLFYDKVLLFHRTQKTLEDVEQKRRPKIQSDNFFQVSRCMRCDQGGKVNIVIAGVIALWM